MYGRRYPHLYRGLLKILKFCIECCNKFFRSISIFQKFQLIILGSEIETCGLVFSVSRLSPSPLDQLTFLLSLGEFLYTRFTCGWTGAALYTYLCHYNRTEGVPCHNPIPILWNLISPSRMSGIVIPTWKDTHTHFIFCAKKINLVAYCQIPAFICKNLGLPASVCQKRTRTPFNGTCGDAETTRSHAGSAIRRQFQCWPKWPVHIWHGSLGKHTVHFQHSPRTVVTDSYQ